MRDRVWQVGHCYSDLPGIPYFSYRQWEFTVSNFHDYGFRMVRGVR